MGRHCRLARRSSQTEERTGGTERWTKQRSRRGSARSWPSSSRWTRRRSCPDARFAEDLNADSLDLVEAVLALEEEWNIEIPEEEMEGVKTVGQAVALVEQKLGVS